MNEWRLTPEEIWNIWNINKDRGDLSPMKQDTLIAQAQLKKIAERLQAGISREELQALYKEAGLEEGGT